MAFYAESETAVRNFLRTQQPLLDLLSNDTRKIDIDTPDGSPKTYIVLYRSGGAPEKNTSKDNPIFSFHCYGAGRGKALELATVLTDVINGMWGNETVDGCSFYRSEVQSLAWLPDPDTGAARYIVRAVIPTRPA